MATEAEHYAVGNAVKAEKLIVGKPDIIGVVSAVVYELLTDYFSLNIFVRPFSTAVVVVLAKPFAKSAPYFFRVER